MSAAASLKAAQHEVGAERELGVRVGLTAEDMCHGGEVLGGAWPQQMVDGRAAAWAGVGMSVRTDGALFRVNRDGPPLE